MNFLKFIEKSKIEKNCDIKRHKMLAVAMCDNGRVLFADTNRKGAGRVSPFSLHAEEFIVKKLRKIRAIQRFGKINMFVARISGGKGIALAKPCNRCLWIMREYGISDIYYTQDGGSIGKVPDYVLDWK